VPAPAMATLSSVADELRSGVGSLLGSIVTLGAATTGRDRVSTGNCDISSATIVAWTTFATPGTIAITVARGVLPAIAVGVGVPESMALKVEVVVGERAATTDGSGIYVRVGLGVGVAVFVGVEVGVAAGAGVARAVLVESKATAEGEADPGAAVPVTGASAGDPVAASPWPVLVAGTLPKNEAIGPGTPAKDRLRLTPIRIPMMMAARV
jgi:hypothetical protein